MKYAKLVYGRNPEQLRSQYYVNIGDWMQTFALEHLYQEMEINPGDIVSIEHTDLTTYSGEPVILPMQGWFGLIKGRDIFPLSQNITPVFLGFHCVTRAFYQKAHLDFYRKY